MKFIDMKRFIVFMSCLCCGLVTMVAQNPYEHLPYVEVRGESELEIVPDEIYLNILIQESDAKTKKIKVEQVEKNMYDVLKRIGIDTNNLMVKDQSSEFRNSLLRTQQIETSKQYSLKLASAMEVAQVFQKLEGIGISNINIEKVNHSKMSQYEQEVKINAAKNAKEKAMGLAQAVGQEIGKALFIQELSSNYGTPLYRSAGGLMKTATMNDSFSEEAAVNIEFEKIKLEYRVFARFELK